MFTKLELEVLDARLREVLLAQVDYKLSPNATTLSVLIAASQRHTKHTEQLLPQYTQPSVKTGRTDSF